MSKKRKRERPTEKGKTTPGEWISGAPKSQHENGNLLKWRRSKQVTNGE